MSGAGRRYRFFTRTPPRPGATEKLVADPALEVLYRVRRGNPRCTAHQLRASLMLAHDRDQSFVDESTWLEA